VVVGGVADGLIDEKLPVEGVHCDAVASTHDNVASNVIDAGALE
jgi:hypothetical protein